MLALKEARDTPKTSKETMDISSLKGVIEAPCIIEVIIEDRATREITTTMKIHTYFINTQALMTDPDFKITLTLKIQSNLDTSDKRR